jgi:transposase/transcription elongation factor Elf1
LEIKTGARIAPARLSKKVVRKYDLFAILFWVVFMLSKNSDRRSEIEFTSLDIMVPADHLLRKIDKVVDFSHIYEKTNHLYCEDNGRPSIDPVVLVKMAFIQHIFGIKSLRQTVKEVDMNIAYRWFLGFSFSTPVPHFSTLSYAFNTRFTSELFESLFAWILEEIASKGFIDSSTVFIDATHIKANANRKKMYKEMALQTARSYDQRLREEINAERIKEGKKPYDDDDNPPKMKEVTKSSSDPDSGLFVKGEHKTEFAYSAHVACDRNNFILGKVVTAGNVHDSRVFDDVYDDVVDKFPKVKTVAVDAGYKTPAICKKVIDDKRNISTPYKRPMGKDGYFRPSEFVYDEYFNCVLCPENKVLRYCGIDRDGYRKFSSNSSDCANCKNKAKCTVSKVKMVLKHIWSNYIELAEDFRHSPEGKASYSLRSRTIERVFADAKEKHGMRYTFLKGLERVNNWITMKFTAMNLKKLAMWAC